MLKCSLTISVNCLRYQSTTAGATNRFRAAFQNSRLAKADHGKPASSQNRFKAVHGHNSRQGGSSHHSYNHENRKGKAFPQRNGSKANPRRPEYTRPMFDLSSGSERTQTALQKLIMKVKKVSSNYDVNFVDPESKKFQTVSLQSLVNKLDLQTDGIKVLPPQGEGFPIIRIVPVSEMLRAYVDELAVSKQQELLELGSARALKAASMRAQAERKKSATKILTLSWSISVSDLLNQKKNEIEKRLKKDGKLMIFVGEKSSLTGARMSAEKEDALVKQLKASNTNWENMDEEENSLEMKKREMIFSKLEEALQDLGCKVEISGSLEARMMIKLTSASKAEKKSDKSELSSKEMRRMRKSDHARKNNQTKERTMAIDDIDSLYSLKIEE